MSFLEGFQQARWPVQGQGSEVSFNAPVKWQRLEAPFLKMNIDAAIFSEQQCMGIGMILRDFLGRAVYCLSKKLHRCWDVKLVEAVCLKEVLSWIYDSQAGNVLIETNAKLVADAFNGEDVDFSTFGCIIQSCRLVSRSCNNVSVFFL